MPSDSESDIDILSSQESDVDCPDVHTDGESSTLKFPRQFLQLFIFISIWQAAFKISTSAICTLLKFLKWFCFAIGTAFNCAPLRNLSNAMPVTKSTLRKILALDGPDFLEYVVCPKCDSLYTPEHCKRGGKFVATACSYKAYPNHPQERRRNECGTQLMRLVRMKKGTVYRPIKLFPHQSIKQAITKLAQRPGFVQSCELWRKRSNFHSFGYMCDVYDGQIWKDYSDFLSAPFNYLLTLNVDWFCPFEHGRYSVGAIYLTIQNLPRSIRNHPDNIILVGIIPGPSEPHLTLNSYMAPVIEELHCAWTEGFRIPARQKDGTELTVTIRLALTCIACDIPATRKICGFLGHRATLGCNKCYTAFAHVTDSDGSKWTNWAGFDRTQWVLRTNQEHRERCDEIIRIFNDHCTKSSIQDAETLYGLRYSVLLELPYFDPIRYPIVDPMHNLYLGTGKHMIEVLLKRMDKDSALDRQKLDKIESLVTQFVVPEGIGRLPSRITCHFGGFTADQWRNWITIYSPVLLWQMIDDQQWNCWMMFVQAVKVISGRILSLAEVTKADDLIVKFCQAFQQLYGDKDCTPNMHMHLHLIQSLTDYGPAHGFWLYAFERYNGILGSYHTNNIRVESQMMRRFLESQSTSISMETLELMDNEFREVLPKHCSSEAVNSPLGNVNAIKLLTAASGPINNFEIEIHRVFYSMVSSIGPFKEHVLTALEVESMVEVLQNIFEPGVTLKSKFSLKFGKLMIGDDLIGSALPNCSLNSSVILAYWPGSLLSGDVDFNVGKVQYYLDVTFTHAQTTAEVRQIFAFVHWLRPHQRRDAFPKDVAIICETRAYPMCKWSYLPVHRILKRCAHITLPLKLSEHVTETVTIACPISLRLNL